MSLNILSKKGRGSLLLILIRTVIEPEQKFTNSHKKSVKNKKQANDIHVHGLLFCFHFV